MAAANRNQSQIIDYLGQQGVDIDERDSRGVTPLMTAVAFGYVQAVKALLNAGADVLAETPKDKLRPLDLVRGDEGKVIVEILNEAISKKRTMGTSRPASRTRKP
jgi:ankyrin repeat protein